jgi:hypothetical protein
VGPTGVQGPAGVGGPQGIQGPTGPTGTPGTQTYFGQGAPTHSFGNTGDFYVDTLTGNIYINY